MRCLLIAWVTLLACISPALAQGWEWLNPLPQGNTLSDLDYLGPNQLFCTGRYGLAIQSADGGQTWNLVNSSLTASPEKVVFTSSSEGWGITTTYFRGYGDSLGNTIFHTADGGHSWQPRYHSRYVELMDISFPSPQYGWVLGMRDTLNPNLVILQTTNGGETWSEQVNDSMGWYARVFFRNTQEGWIALYNSMMHTTNGGLSWDCFTSTPRVYYDMVFIDSQHGWGGDWDNLYATTDGGHNWVPENLPEVGYRGIRSIAVVDADHIWAAGGGGNVYHTTNGGQTWTYAVVDSENSLDKIIFSDPQHAWVSGESGTVYQSTNGGATWSHRTTDVLAGEEFQLSAVDFVDLQNGWMAGRDYGYHANAPILHTTNGGTSWSIQYWDTLTSFNDIKAVSPTNIWAAGTGIVHSTDGGLHWNPVNVGNIGTVYKIVCPDDQTIWLFSGSSSLSLSTDGGATWSARSTNAEFVDIAASDANHVWGVLYTGCMSCMEYEAVSYSSDGGQTWTLQMDSVGAAQVVTFIDYLHGWAATWQGIYRTTDGGETWSHVSNVVVEARHLQFLDESNGWVIGYYGDAYRTTDGGYTWQCLDPYVEYSLSGADFVDASHGWIAGGHQVLRFDASVLESPTPVAPQPRAFALHPVYPNPFNAVTTLTFDLPSAGRTRIEVFDITGRLVQTVADELYAPGRHSIRFDAGGLPSGLYFARATAGDFRAVQKMILLR